MTTKKRELERPNVRWPRRIKVAFWTDSYAPTMVQAQPLVPVYTNAYLATVRENGGDAKESSVLLSYWDAREFLRPRTYRQLVDGASITALLDPWEFGHCYGYDAHTVVDRGGTR